uniref:Pleckstrin homology domain-containing family M member 1-like n=1 Tax=Hirondellea gigas TaxID=1518452 RepID=A0A2P2I4M6_9CRUS
MSSKKEKQAKRDEILRFQLLEHINDVVQSLLKPIGDTSKLYVRHPQPNADPTRVPVKVFGTSDLTNTLCSSLEAVFIHGLKNSYSSRVSSFFVSDPDMMPVPNFWPVVMSVCHKDDIKEVCNLAFITSDVGRGRSWLRLIINSCQVSSYIDALTRELSVLKDYYSPTSLLRTPECCFQLQGTLLPLSTLQFQLATNSAVLNTWTQTPLILSGLWMPPAGHTVHGWSQPVKEGIDAASTLLYTEQREHETKRPDVFMEETPLDDHLFYAILAATPSTNFIDSADAAEKSDVEEIPKKKPLVVRTLHPKLDRFGNVYIPPKDLLNNEEQTDQSNLTDDKDTGIGTMEDSVPNKSSKDEESNRGGDQHHRASSECSDSLVGSYIMDRSEDGSIITSASSLDYATLIARRLDNVDYRYITNNGQFFGASGALLEGQEETTTPSPEETDDASSTDHDFEVVAHDKKALQVQRVSSLVARLCTQYGLDEQNYQCYQCRAFIGMFYGESRVCSMDGRSYCIVCHSNELAIVPARVLYNWDLRQHAVCDSTSRWLGENYDVPMLDIRATNPKLYNHVDELEQLKSLRTQLQYLRAYLFTCSTEGVAAKLRLLLPEREHFYEHVHLYSLADLVLISRGGLLSEVQEAVCFARLHIRDCKRCVARGFHCEICSRNDVIFPYELDIAQTCPECCGVYHRRCARTVTACPRCVRRKARKQKLVEVEQAIEATEELDELDTRTTQNAAARHSEETEASSTR